MKNEKEFIHRVTKKLAWFKGGFETIESESTPNEFSNSILFVTNSIGNKSANDFVITHATCSSSKVLTFDKFGGISLIIPFECESDDNINIQSLGVINSFLNHYENVTNQIANIEFKKEEQEDAEHISLKDYYRLNLPDNRIGRKSDETLIKELEEAGFGV